MSADRAALAGKWREIRVLIYPSQLGTASTVAVVARRVNGTVQRDNLLWRGQVDTPDGIDSVAQVIGNAAACLLAVSDDLSD